MEKVITILLIIILAAVIVAIQLYLNLDKHRFRILQQWKHMSPGIDEWVDNSAELLERLKPSPEKAGLIARDIEKYRSSRKKTFPQLEAVNSLHDELVKLLVPGGFCDPETDSLLSLREDIENDLHSSIYSFNISVNALNAQLERPLFQLIGKLSRIGTVEKLRVGKG